MMRRMAACLDPWMRRSVMAMGFTRRTAPSLVRTWKVPSTRERFRRVSRRT